MVVVILLLPICARFTPGFVNYKKDCTRLASVSDKVYQLLAHGWWLSLGTPTSSTTKIGRLDIAEILLKVALNTKYKIKSNHTCTKGYNMLLVNNHSKENIDTTNIFQIN